MRCPLDLFGRKHRVRIIAQASCIGFELLCKYLRCCGTSLAGFPTYEEDVFQCNASAMIMMAMMRIAIGAAFGIKWLAYVCYDRLKTKQHMFDYMVMADKNALRLNLRR